MTARTLSATFGLCPPWAGTLQKQCGRTLFALIFALNILGLAGGTTPARVVSPAAPAPTAPVEEEESHPTGKAKSESVVVEHRRHHRHETLYRPAPGGPAIRITDTDAERRPSLVPAHIVAEFDGMNGLGAPLLC